MRCLHEVPQPAAKEAMTAAAAAVSWGGRVGGLEGHGLNTAKLSRRRPAAQEAAAAAVAASWGV